MTSIPTSAAPARHYPIYQVDAFAGALFAGNPAAVVVLDSFPDDALLRDIAGENNLSETAFLVPDAGQYKIRWFTPTLEVPMCGHATLASAAVVMERLQVGRTQVTFMSASGALTVSRTRHGYRMNFPRRTPVPVATPPGLAAALGVVPAATLDDTFNYIALFDSASAIGELAPDLGAIAALDRTGVVVTAPGGAAYPSYDFVSRYFAPAKGIAEDPVTGGAHCALTPYWAARLDKTVLRAYQASRRGGELLCRMAAERVELEGTCVFYLEGRITV